MSDDHLIDIIFLIGALVIILAAVFLPSTRRGK
jgi:hypothetical protein